MRLVLFVWSAVIAAALGMIPESAAVARPLSHQLTRFDAAIRVSAATGRLAEITWAYPGVDLVGTMRLGPARRGFVELQLGYVPVDNHTFLADGRAVRLAVVGGARFLPGRTLRLGAAFAFETLFFHADPDVVNEHPGGDVLAPRVDFFPAAGLEVSYDLGAAVSVGVFGRVGLTEVTLFREGDVDPQATGGEEGRARLVLLGFFVQVRLR
jgi:hypothetical protein